MKRSVLFLGVCFVLVAFSACKSYDVKDNNEQETKSHGEYY